MKKLPVYDMRGQKVDELELPGNIFGLDPNIPVMHQALVRQLANARRGTHKTKTRGETTGYSSLHRAGLFGSTSKPWPQKGTGRARHGSTVEPQWRGGGIAHGPRPRSYRQKMPKKMRRLALRSALSVKAAENRIVVLDKLEMPEPKTKRMAAILNALAIDSSALILLPERNENVEKSAHNLPKVKTLRAHYLNIRDLFTHDYLIMPLGALETIKTFLS